MFRKILGYATLPLFLLLLWIMPPRAGRAQSPPQGFNQGPDIITGEVGPYDGLVEFGSSGTQVGLAMWTTICNAGNVPVDVFAMPATNHAIIPQNLYRMSRGADNNERFEQIGHSWVKHMFASSTMNDCGFGCTSAGTDTLLGVGCSDVYAHDQNATQHDLTSRAWINPFTGVFSSASRNHAGHVHTGTSHRLLVESTDLNTAVNPGATYYAEVQYLSPHEYNWCQGHPGQCNMYNNASYRQFNVSGTTSFTFTPAAPSVLESPAVTAWTGATINPIEPEPGVDGRAFIAYKVTGPDAGVWHYEYALYNMNLDRAIQSFSVPLGCAITVNNLGFHAPPNHPGFPNDGTLGDAGFSNAPWTSSQTTDAVSWSSETFAQNQNANAIRWGTLYNFRFDSNKPPIGTNATIGFFKTGAPVAVAILGPNACDQIPSPTPSLTPGVTPTPTATTTPPPSPTPSPTPLPPTGPINLSTRMLVQTGDNVGIGGFIILGSDPKRVMLRAVGPSTVPGALSDPVLELHGPSGFVTIVNDNCDPGPFCPPGTLDSLIEATLNPGLYTAVVRGNNDTTGVALVEVYDLDQGVGSRLANISTRAFVETANNIVIAGFILDGSGNDTQIVVRGIGPSLAAHGVANPLSDPTLELRNENGLILAENNDWQNGPPVPPNLAPGSALESVISVTLAPGPYTALLAGVNNGTGPGLVEVYDLGAPDPVPTLPPPPASPSPSPPASPSPSPPASPSPSPPVSTPTPTPISEPCIEGFDSVTAPALPPGWSAGIILGDPPTWETSTTDPDSAPNDLFVNNENGISLKEVISPHRFITSASAQLSFRNNFNTDYDPPPTEVFWDGFVLEVSINGEPFHDVTSPEVGGSFVSGSYTGEIHVNSTNPLAGRIAWSGNSGGYINTVINLPAILQGQTIRLRFVMGTDGAVAAPGVRIDSLNITGASCP